MKVRRSFVSLICFLILSVTVQAQEYQVYEVDNGGTLSGTVILNGKPPAPRVITVTKDKEIAGEPTREVNVVKVKDGKLAEAVVYLEEVEAGKAWPTLPGGGAINQKGARFLPSSKVIHKGMEVPIKNSDSVMHNIHSYELIGRGRRTLFNVGQIANLTIRKSFAVKRSPFVKIECDAHNFMHEYLFVASNPYYSVTGENGTFEIADIPEGTYILKVWHPNLGTQEAEVTVGAGQTATRDFTFKHKGGTK